MNNGAGPTTTVMAIDWTRLPLAPVTSTVKIPVAEAVKTQVDNPEPPGGRAMTLGVQITIKPEGGETEAASMTVPVKVPILATVMRSEPDPPAGIERDDAAALRLKGEIVTTVRFAHVPMAGLLLESPL